MLRQILYSLFRRLPIKRNRVLLIGYYGSQYGCNPKYISQELVKNYSDKVEVVWAFVHPSKHNVQGAKIVKYNSPAYFYMLATSKVICTNYRMTSNFVKRADQKYIQTWHSSLRLKKIEGDTESTLPEHYVRMAKQDSAKIDYVLAGCQKSHDTFANSFWYSGNILDFGTPRNDLLIQNPTELKAEVKKRLSIPLHKKIVLYAPTFRKDKGTECYNLDFARVCTALEKRFGEEWTVVLRLHPHLSGTNIFKDMDNVVDATSYDDIQELLLTSDVLISDYSSLMFDFAISGKPVLLYASDLEEYCRNDRALYFDVHSLPFPIARDNDSLVAAVQDFCPSRYSDALKRFNKSVGTFEEGNASSKVSELIISLIEK